MSPAAFGFPAELHSQHMVCMRPRPRTALAWQRSSMAQLAAAGCPCTVCPPAKARCFGLAKWSRYRCVNGAASIAVCRSSGRECATSPLCGDGRPLWRGWKRELSRRPSQRSTKCSSFSTLKEEARDSNREVYRKLIDVFLERDRADWPKLMTYSKTWRSMAESVFEEMAIMAREMEDPDKSGGGP